jgi:hypothetical protein
MTKLTNKKEHLSSLIEGAVIAAGDDGITANKIMKMFKIGRTCSRLHLAQLELDGHIRKVRRHMPVTNGVYHTYHKTEGSPTPAKDTPARRDWLVAAFFGPARTEGA